MAIAHTASPTEKPSRPTIPLLIDLVTVSNPEQQLQSIRYRTYGAIAPPNYAQGVKSQAQIMNDCEQALPKLAQATDAASVGIAQPVLF